MIAVVSCMLRYKSFLSDVNGLWLSCLNFWLSNLSTLSATTEGYSNKYSLGKVKRSIKNGQPGDTGTLGTQDIGRRQKKINTTQHTEN